LVQQQRYAEAATAIRNSAGLSYQESFERYRLLGRIYLAMNDAHTALAAFDQAEKREPLEIREHGNEFKAQLAEARGRAWGMLGDKARALQFQQQAVELTPKSAARWNDLAIVYDAVGDKAKAADARAKAAALGRR
jgi:tetratricopeptide (TPR) repeat protein